MRPLFGVLVAIELERCVVHRRLLEHSLRARRRSCSRFFERLHLERVVVARRRTFRDRRGRLRSARQKQRREQRFRSLGRQPGRGDELSNVARRGEERGRASIGLGQGGAILQLGPIHRQSHRMITQPLQHFRASRALRVRLERVDHARDRIDRDLHRPRRRRLPTAPFVRPFAEREEPNQVLAMLHGERGAQLLRREEPLLDEHLAVPFVCLGRRELGRLDLQRISPVVREHDVRQRVRSVERRRAAHIAGAKEGADLSGPRRLDHQRAARLRSEYRGHQLGGARRTQVSLGQRGQQLEGVHAGNMLPGLPRLTRN